MTNFRYSSNFPNKFFGISVTKLSWEIWAVLPTAHSPLSHIIYSHLSRQGGPASSKSSSLSSSPLALTPSASLPCYLSPSMHWLLFEEMQSGRKMLHEDCNVELSDRRFKAKWWKQPLKPAAGLIIPIFNILPCVDASPSLVESLCDVDSLVRSNHTDWRVCGRI